MLSLMFTMIIRCQTNPDHLNREKYVVGYEVTIIAPKIRVLQGNKSFKCYLANAKNKVNLTAFQWKELISISKNTLDHGKTLFTSYGCEGRRIVKGVKNGEKDDIPTLASKNVETDGCLLMNASNKAKIASQVSVSSVLCVHFCRQIVA